VIGEGALLAAGALITKDVPPWKLAIGSPARIFDLQKKYHVLNFIGD
jgi:acetyltransferase-like isoleucine patch superfamily enzyme